MFVWSNRRLGEACLARWIHPRQWIGRIFDTTDPTYVNLCLDSPHVVYGGGRARW